MSPTPAPLPTDLAQGLALVGERLGLFGGDVLWYPDVGSTNDVAGVLAEHGAGEGVVVVAERQTAGRGRYGRVWASPAGAGLYLSVVLRPVRPAPLLTLAAGVAVAEGLLASTGLQASLKWPNDVHLGERKVAGILAESTASHTILGVGINLRQAGYPPDVAARATSVEVELGRSVDRGLVLGACLCALTARYRDLQAGCAAAIVTAWRARAAATMGRRVEWESDGQRRQGTAEGIAEDGALLVRAESGLVRVLSGEVRWT
jgi:BirA family biotin operon repressor/biotin-[acetyl-CoA-carboxylase] ligase